MKTERQKDLLSKKTYRQVVKMLEHYKKQHEEDRIENPNAIPPAWGIPLRHAIEKIVRENREPCYKGLPDQVLEYLCSKKMLVHYAGDYTFPSDERLPTRAEIIAHAQKWMKHAT